MAKLFTTAKLNTKLDIVDTLFDLYNLTVVTPITLKFDKNRKWKLGTTRILNGDLYVFYRDPNTYKLVSCEVRPMMEKKWYALKQM